MTFTTKRSLVRTGLLAATALALSGCGDGGSAAPATSPDAGSASATVGDATGEEGEAWPDSLTLAVIPAEGAEGLVDGYEPMISLLEQELGLSIELQEATGNAAVIEAQVAERADLAMYGAFSYYLASQNAEIEPLVSTQRVPGGDPGIRSYAVVPQGSDITSLEDAAGSDICFTDPASTSGYLAPLAGLLDAGVDPEADATIVYAGGHDSSVISAVSGDCDVAFAADMFVDVLLPAQGVVEEGDVEVIWESPLIPEPPLAAGAWLPEDLRTAIQEALTSTNAVEMAEQGLCEGDSQQFEAPDSFGEDVAGAPACVLALQEIYGFVTVDEDTYQPIADICETTQAEACAAAG